MRAQGDEVYGLAGGEPEMDTPDHIKAAAVKALQDPNVKKRLHDAGAYPDGNTPQQYAAQIKRELELRKKIAVDQNITLE